MEPPADTTHTSGGGNTVQRVPLTLTVRLFPADSTLGSAVGWSGGAVPGAVVALQRSGSSDTALHAVSDSVGAIHFPAVLTGTYSVSALRVLDSTERPRLPAGYKDVDAVGSGGQIGVDTPSAVASLSVPASHRGSIQVSEYWFPLSLTEDPQPFYPYAGYLELYNNADTTVYLDGLTFGDGLMAITTEGAYNTCDDYRDMLDDSTGIWAADIFRFPGSGHDHPLGPGQTAVLATDAVDHTQVRGDATDLSGANFEFIGSSDVDNPAVPNMINLGEHVTPLDHGWYGPFAAAPFVALALEPDTLPTRVVYTFSERYYHIARSAIIAFSLFYTEDPRYPDCVPVVSPVFDAGRAFLPFADFYAPSYKRKVLRYLPDGRAVLQNTRTSANDFEFTLPRTPGAVP